VKVNRHIGAFVFYRSIICCSLLTFAPR
jgi:hypothetical protein